MISVRRQVLPALQVASIVRRGAITHSNLLTADDALPKPGGWLRRQAISEPFVRPSSRQQQDQQVGSGFLDLDSCGVPSGRIDATEHDEGGAGESGEDVTPANNPARADVQFISELPAEMGEPPNALPGRRHR